VEGSLQWVFATPYIATRYAKTRGRNRIDLLSPAAHAQFVARDLKQQIPAVLNVDADEVIIEPLCDVNGVFRVPVGDARLADSPLNKPGFFEDFFDSFRIEESDPAAVRRHYADRRDRPAARFDRPAQKLTAS